MTKGQRTITALLGAITILLALNLVSEPEAMGQGQPDSPGAPDAAVVPVAMSVVPAGIRYRVFRMWSDGSVDTTLVRFSGSPGFACFLHGEGTCTVDVPTD